MYFSVTCGILKLKPYVGVKRDDDDDDDDDDNDDDVAVEDDDDELNHLFLLRERTDKKIKSESVYLSINRLTYNATVEFR